MKAKKNRIPISSELSAKILFESDRTCCVCRDRSKHVQIHHIDENPSNNAIQNLSVLCFECHNDTQLSGGFGKKLKAVDVITYRDDWLDRVEKRRSDADKLATSIMAGESDSGTVNIHFESIYELEGLSEYVVNLPSILVAARKLAQPQIDIGTTFDMVEGTFKIVDIVVQILVRLASWFPENHFDEKSADEYFSELVSQRIAWNRALAEPLGEGTGGTIVKVGTAFGVLSDMEDAVAEMVSALFLGQEGFNEEALKQWNVAWEKAREY